MNPVFIKRALSDRPTLLKRTRAGSRVGAAAGFTLIEVMVAISLMAIVAILSWRGLDSVSKAGERIDASAADTEVVLRSVGQLSRDVMLRAPVGVLPMPPVPTGTNVPTTLLPSSISVDRRLDGSLVFGIVRAAVGEPGNWQRVAWSVDNGVLRRRIGLAASVLPLPSVDGAIDPTRNPVAEVMPDVQGLSLRAWVPQRGWVGLPAADGLVAATGLEVAIVRNGPTGPETFRQVMVFE
ncbi:prepilin-type N-terminal cleavage/methylation domain-containing protein [Pigmentiphaga aceris]|uniref:Prepilin-type N-terminal cleavage/methylation domain-containing protein n=1 Tax=Pigmentiphaga aceris TaxID=1940612 RepID=A0A5C0B5C6_9BURK|nr:prepilin-type N-terminal cleavage/methylation domain-containing protein [Pigmentiphaga aceris]QEI08490.1 prepilin-type N-terminal cleavage/methylation domain-containing protein [Pigmentiphaga aceris]